MKTKYKKVIEFYNTTTPEQHAYFLELIRNSLSFYSEEHQQFFTPDEETMIYLNGALIQIDID